jgi:hypothetical protein
MNDIIKERYCSVGVALLLKEKGMNKKNLSHYIQKNNEDGTSEIVSTCTHQVATDWLRKFHNLFIEIRVGESDKKLWYDYDIIPINGKEIDWKNYKETPFVEYDSYGEVCDDAIMYCLENLI